MTRVRTFAIVATLLGLSGAPAAANEVWVVNGGKFGIQVIDGVAEQVVAAIPLDDVTDPPRCVAFSSVPGSAGAFAFVSQGPLIRVIDTAQRAVSHDVDVSALLGSPVELRGCAAARPREFEDGQGAAVRSYLHVAAQVDTGGAAPEPCFIVFDQALLLSNPQDPGLIVANDALGATPPGAVREALDVTVLPHEHGPHFQRAWYSYRETSPDPALFAALVAAERTLGSGWGVVRERIEPLPNTPGLPDGIQLGVTFDRELVAWPTADGQQLLNPQTAGGGCDLPGTRLRGVAIAGRGPGSHTVIAIDDGASPGWAHRLDPASCDFVSTTVGLDPVAVAMFDSREWTKAFVANRDSDTVTVLRSDSTVGSITLEPGAPPCLLCPLDIEALLGGPLECTVRNVRAERSGSDVVLSWDTVGCSPDTQFRVLCVCQDPGGVCPPGCPSGPLSSLGGEEADTLAPLESGMSCDGDWKEADTTGPGANSYLHSGGATGGSVCYNVR